MVEFLPQWRGSGQRDAALSKRSLSVDIGMSDIQMDDVISTVDLLDKFREEIGRASCRERVLASV